MKYLLFLPGYIFIWVLYFFPVEWGKKRNVARGGRWFKYQDVFAPVVSILFYLLIIIMALGGSSDKSSATLPNSGTVELKASVKPTAKEVNALPSEPTLMAVPTVGGSTNEVGSNPVRVNEPGVSKEKIVSDSDEKTGEAPPPSQRMMDTKTPE